MKRRIIGVVVEILSEKKYLGKHGEGCGQRWLNSSDGHITHCIVLPKGCVFDNISGLKFQIDVAKGDQKENVFYFPWERILEARTLDGRPLYRNWYLCPTCRRITNFFPGSKAFCKHCLSGITSEENRKVCISPFQEE